MSIQSALERFVSSEQPAAIVLQGKWGIGKTYFWRRRVIEPYLAKSRREKYSYVSLFGINSLAELKVAIYQATKEFDYDLRNKRWRYVHPRWLWWRAQPLLPNVIASASVPYVGGGIGKSFDALSFYMTRNRLICFDDIERRGDGLALIDFLGLVSHLVDERNCRVAVILNTGALKADQEIWDENKEKVFQGEMEYAPSLTQTIELGLDGLEQERWYKTARDSLQKLQVSNIRIVQRTGRFIKAAVDAAGERVLREETLESIARVVPLLTFASSGRAQGAPPLDFVMQSGRFDLALYSMSDEKDKPEQELRWTQLISDYQVFIGDSLDKALCQMIVSGYPDPAILGPAIDDFETSAQRRANQEASKRAWMLYHHSLADNGEELADALETTWGLVSSEENVLNVQATARLLRLLGRPEVATRLIQTWVDQRKGSRIEELSSDELNMFGAPTDIELLAAIDAANMEKRPSISLTAALKAMASNEGISDYAVMAIAEASPIQIANTLTENADSNLVRTMRNTLNLGAHHEKPYWAEARDKMKEAAIELSKRSPINADRMRNWFGITANETKRDS